MSKKPRSRSTPNPGWFRKGHSGNRNGRPKVSRAPKASAFEALVDKTLIVAGNGGDHEITVEAALQRRLYQDALAGKGMAIRQVAKWMIEREAWLAEHAPKTRWPKIKQHTSPDPDNADAALLILGIAVPNPARTDIGADRTPLLLALWAVQAALRRRRGGQRLTDKEREDIRRRMRDPDLLRWPRETGE
jgi:Family of unknown function (DUF5681)